MKIKFKEKASKTGYIKTSDVELYDDDGKKIESPCFSINIIIEPDDVIRANIGFFVSEIEDGEFNLHRIGGVKSVKNDVKSVKNVKT